MIEAIESMGYNHPYHPPISFAGSGHSPLSLLGDNGYIPGIGYEGRYLNGDGFLSTYASWPIRKITATTHATFLIFYPDHTSTITGTASKT